MVVAPHTMAAKVNMVDLAKRIVQTDRELSGAKAKKTDAIQERLRKLHEVQEAEKRIKESQEAEKAFEKKIQDQQAALVAHMLSSPIPEVSLKYVNLNMHKYPPHPPHPLVPPSTTSPTTFTLPFNLPSHSPSTPQELLPSLTSTTSPCPPLS